MRYKVSDPGALAQRTSPPRSCKAYNIAGEGKPSVDMGSGRTFTVTLLLAIGLVAVALVTAFVSRVRVIPAGAPGEAAAQSATAAMLVILVFFLPAA